MGIIIISGGSFVLVILIIILLIAAMFGSAFGFLFSNEIPKTEESIPINSAVKSLEDEIAEKIEKIKSKTDYDTVRIDKKEITWREVLSVYTVVTTNRENKFNIMEMNSNNYEKLSEIFWEVVEVEHYKEKYKVRYTTTDKNGNKVTKRKTKTRLIINVKVMSLEEMMEHYNMSKSEKKQVNEMMDEQFDEMWNVILPR